LRARKGGQALGSQAARGSGAGVAREERERDRAVDVGEDALGAGPEAVELGAQLVGELDAHGDEVLACAQQRLQRDRLVAGGRERGEAVLIGAAELAEHERVEAIGLARGRAEAIARGGELVGMDRQHADPGRQQPADQQPFGSLDRDARHAMADQQLDQRGNAGLVVREAPLDEQLAAVCLSNANVVPFGGPVDAGDCGHAVCSQLGLVFTQADREVPWRVLTGRPSMGRRPVAAPGASHRREALVSSGPSARPASEALSRRWSALYAAQSQGRPSPLNRTGSTEGCPMSTRRRRLP
jgi:hypothetical protein